MSKVLKIYFGSRTGRYIWNSGQLLGCTAPANLQNSKMDEWMGFEWGYLPHTSMSIWWLVQFKTQFVVLISFFSNKGINWKEVEKWKINWKKCFSFRFVIYPKPGNLLWLAGEMLWKLFDRYLQKDEKKNWSTKCARQIGACNHQSLQGRVKV